MTRSSDCMVFKQLYIENFRVRKICSMLYVPSAVVAEDYVCHRDVQI